MRNTDLDSPSTPREECRVAAIISIPHQCRAGVQKHSISKLCIIFLTRVVSREPGLRKRQQWQREGSGCVTGGRGLCPVAEDKREGLPVYKDFLCQVFLKETLQFTFAMVTSHGGYFMNKEDTKGSYGLHTRIIAFTKMCQLIKYPPYVSDTTQILLPITYFGFYSFLEVESTFFSQLFSF